MGVDIDDVGKEEPVNPVVTAVGVVAACVVLFLLLGRLLVAMVEGLVGRRRAHRDVG